MGRQGGEARWGGKGSHNFHPSTVPTPAPTGLTFGVILQLLKLLHKCDDHIFHLALNIVE